MRWLWLALLLVISAGAAAEDVWRWVDQDGVIHFSDRPHPGAERVQIGPVQSCPAPELPPPRETTSDQPDAPASPYSRVEIASPAGGETLWNIGGELSVQVTVEPQLAGGHELRIYLDGNPAEGVSQGPGQVTLGEVYRGEHTLRAAIFDAEGRELASSETITFYVQQTSAQNPAQQGQPTRPRPRPAGGG